MKKSVFLIKKMDCPSEEQMIRMKLSELPGITNLHFDLPGRKLDVFHDTEIDAIEKTIAGLNLDSNLLETGESDEITGEKYDINERRLLIYVLLINFSLFIVEVIAGYLAGSMGLIADSLDMLADAIVYGLSLYAVGHAVARKKQIAKIAGYFQFILAILGFFEVIRRFLGFEQIPVFETMIIVSLIALSGNVASLILLSKAKDTGAHMKASWIFTSNDVIANLGVIIAGVLVYLLISPVPDLIIGSLVFLLVARGAYRIYQLSN
jgi:Co/Zn/Cd efflux system component